MLDSGKDWKVTRTCTRCGHQDTMHVSRREAAFNLVDVNAVLGRVCTRCAATTFSAASYMPELDFELLREWATNEDLYLLEQDEELVLAEEKHFNTMLQVLDTVPVLEDKRNILLHALCVLVYDNTPGHDPHPNDELRSKVIAELNKRQDVLRLTDNWIMDYIKEVMYPQLSWAD